jgi:hypothetical protein
MHTSSGSLPNVHIQTATTADFSTIPLMVLRTVNPVATTVYSNPTFWDRPFISYFGGGGAQQPYSVLGRMVEVSMSQIDAPYSVGILSTRYQAVWLPPDNAQH